MKLILFFYQARLLMVIEVVDTVKHHIFAAS